MKVYPLSLVALLAMSACVSAPEGGMQVRGGPQSQSPSGQTTVSAVQQEATQIAGMQGALDATPEGFGTQVVASVFPDLGDASSAFAAGFGPFQNVCLSASPDLNALATAARRSGLDVERQGNTIVGGPTNGAPVSLQINNVTAFDFECGVTTLQDGPDDGTIRNAFFDALGQTHTDGVGSISVGGETFILKHITFSAFGATEHVFLLQQ